MNKVTNSVSVLYFLFKNMTWITETRRMGENPNLGRFTSFVVCFLLSGGFLTALPNSQLLWKSVTVKCINLTLFYLYLKKIDQHP